MGSEQALLVEMSKPAWDEDFHEFKSLPETAEKTEVLEKQKDESDAVEAEIAALAKRLVDTGENLRAGGGLGLLSAP